MVKSALSALITSFVESVSRATSSKTISAIFVLNNGQAALIASTTKQALQAQAGESFQIIRPQPYLALSRSTHASYKVSTQIQSPSSVSLAVSNKRMDSTSTGTGRYSRARSSETALRASAAILAALSALMVTT